jgi:N-acyl-D-aspartate/D-glutamate deacylase
MSRATMWRRYLLTVVRSIIHAAADLLLLGVANVLHRGFVGPKAILRNRPWLSHGASSAFSSDISQQGPMLAAAKISRHPPWACSVMEEPVLDLIIKNAKIVDGGGGARYDGDIGVRDGLITAVGEVRDTAEKVLDAEGRVVAPGFIDVHTHYDAQAFWDPTLSPSCFHGVTTVYGGFCGFSIAPLSKEAAPYLLKMLARVEGMPVPTLEAGVPWDWRSFDDFLGRLDGRIGLNAGFMAGHSAIRCVVMGDRARSEKAGAEEIAAMKRLLAECLEAGAMGFSTTLGSSHNDAEGKPVPSRYAAYAELIELARVCGDYPGTSLEMIPQIGRFSEEVIQLMVDMSTASRRPLNWNVLLTDDAEYLSHQLSATDRARKAGGDVLALAAVEYPTARVNFHSGFALDTIGGWDKLFAIPPERRIEYLKDPKKRAAILHSAMTETVPILKRWLNWETYVVDAVFSEENKPALGRTVGSVAEERGRSPFDTLLDLAVADGLRTTFLLSTPDNEPAVWRRRAETWLDDRTIIGGSDAGAHLDMSDTFAIPTQLLARGVREFGVISLEEAVRQLTSVPAQLYGLKGRGRLEVGYHADMVVFDPDTVGRAAPYMRHDLPGGEVRVYAEANGIDHVFVNGVSIVDKGQHTGTLPGKVLRSGVDTVNASMPVHAGALKLERVE